MPSWIKALMLVAVASWLSQGMAQPVPNERVAPAPISADEPGSSLNMGPDQSTSISSVPLDPEAFTAYFAQRARSMNSDTTGIKVAVVQPLVVSFISRSGKAFQANLSQLHGHCIAVEGRCADSVDWHLGWQVQALTDSGVDDNAGMLRAVVRSAEYVKAVNQMMQSRGQPPLAARPYVGELWMVLAIDRPAFLVMATIDVLKRFGLDEQSAFGIALQNVARSKRPILDRALPLRGTHFQVLEEDSYEASRLLFHRDWAGVAQSRTGDLIVGVPAFNSIVFGRARTKEDVAALHKITQKRKGKAVQPLTLNSFGGALMVGSLSTRTNTR